MKLVVAIVCVISGLAGAASAAISGRYIVGMTPDLSERAMEEHLERLIPRQGLSGPWVASVERTFGFGGFRAYVGEFDDDSLDEIRERDEVAFVEPDFEGGVAGLVQEPGEPWGLFSISSRAPAPTDDVVNQTYIYDDSAGTGTFVYVLDTGIRTNISEFGGRAIKGYNVWPEVAFDDDLGHGTAVAGVIGSTTFGVAKNTTIIDVKTVKVTNGTVAKAIEALEWVAQNATGTPGRVGRSVINISLAFPASDALNQAVDALTCLGVLVVVGAGNNGADAATISPASAPTAFAVGGIAINNSKADWSNYGPSVDIFAPGVDVLSPWAGIEGGTLSSGTSVASPHVAGLAAYLKGLEGRSLDSPQAVAARMRELATRDVVVGAGQGSPNLLAYNGNGR